MIKICKRCNKEIKKHEKGTTWITFEGNKELEIIHWHFDCFLEWRDENFQRGAMELYKKSMNVAIPQLKSLLSTLKT